MDQVLPAAVTLIGVLTVAVMVILRRVDRYLDIRERELSDRAQVPVTISRKAETVAAIEARTFGGEIYYPPDDHEVRLYREANSLPESR